MKERSQRLVLDSGVRRSAGGRLLIGGAPARLIRLSDAGSAALDRVLAGEPQSGDLVLADRLCEHGMLHPVASERLAEVTFVIPVRDGGEPLLHLVEGVRRWGPVIVVDDGSSDDSARRAESAGARLISNTPGPHGPGPARNLGLAAVETDFVAFVDADCRCPRDWARPLAALLAADPSLALIAPRVRSALGGDAIARYERQRSPLDLGGKPALVAPGGRIGYLPAAALVARRTALEQLHGFDPELRFGEDVDLVWRALAAGWSVRYAPEVEVEHLPRHSVADLARQRFDYGCSAAALDRRHPGAVAPLRIDRGPSLVVLGALADSRRGAAIAGVAHLAWVGLQQPEHATALPLIRAATHGLLVSGRQLCRSTARDWLPLTLLAVLLSRRARPYAAAALAVDAASGVSRDRTLLMPSSLLLRLVENAAYASGLWRGVIGERSFRALLPRLRLR